MPNVADYETEQAWMSACVPVRKDEGDEQDQAVAVCLSMWRNRNKASNVLKAISSTDAELRVGNYIVQFGGRDLEGYGSPRVNPDGSKGEYFSPRTQLDSTYTKAGALYVDWEHRQKELGDEVLGYVDWKTAQVDDYGVFVERVLSRRNKYVRWVESLIEQGLIGTSSEADPHGQVEKAADGEILAWPLYRDTLSVFPMDYRNMKEFGENTLQAFKALGIPVPDDTTEEEHEPPAEAEPEGAKASASVARLARVHIQQFRNELLKEA